MQNYRLPKKKATSTYLLQTFLNKKMQNKVKTALFYFE